MASKTFNVAQSRRSPRAGWISIGTRIRRARLDRKLSLVDLSACTGVRPQTIFNCEMQRQIPLGDRQALETWLAHLAPTTRGASSET